MVIRYNNYVLILDGITIVPEPANPHESKLKQGSISKYP